MIESGEVTSQANWVWRRIMILFEDTPIDRHVRLVKLLYQIPDVEDFAKITGTNSWRNFGITKLGTE